MIDKHLPRLCLTQLLAIGAALAQPAAAPLAFEAATVRPSAPFEAAAAIAGKAHTGTRIDSSRVDIGTATLFRLICVAYRVRPYQLSGPDWLKTTTYDIQAKIPDGVSVDKVPEMLQTLLAERFGLKLHPEKKDQPVYALVIGPGGASGIKMKESEPEPPPPPTAPNTPKPEMTVPTVQGDVKLDRTDKGISHEMPGGEKQGRIRVAVSPPTGSQPPKFHLESSGTTMKSFAQMLSVGVVDRPVVDMTGLTGAYEVAVDLSLDDAMNVARNSVTLLPTGGGGGGDGGKGAGAAGANLADPSGSSIFASIQNLGLKLEPRKLPLELLVVDHMEKTPTAN